MGCVLSAAGLDFDSDFLVALQYKPTESDSRILITTIAHYCHAISSIHKSALNIQTQHHPPHSQPLPCLPKDAPCPNYDLEP